MKKISTWGMIFLFFEIQIYANWVRAQVTYEDFKSINRALINLFTPAFKETGDVILLREIWGDYSGPLKQESSIKDLNENKITVTLTGKMASHPNITEDAWAIVGCHEVGHIIGGAPRQSLALTKWSSVEGQADYFSTNKCMWDYVQGDPNHIKVGTLASQLFKECQETYPEQLVKINQCARIMTAIISVQNYFNATSSKNHPVSLFSKDETRVKKTRNKFGTNQCRLDTLKAGVLNGTRPGCWFKDEVAASSTT